MKLLRLVLTLLLLPAAFTSPARAQDAAGCGDADVAAVVLQSLDTLNAVPADDSSASGLKALQSVGDQIAALQSACAGLNFNGSGQVVLGPLTIPPGVYRVSGVFSDYASAVTERLSGECGLSYSESDPLFGVLRSDAGKTSQTVFRSQGCQALLQVNTTGPWSIDFEFVSPPSS